MNALARSAAPLALSAALALALTGAPAPARADAVAEGKAHFKKGSDYYREGKYQEAIGEFQAAYRLRPSGVLHYNVAQCYEKLGDLPNALRAYRDYLRETPNADDRPSIEATVAGIEKKLAERGVQALVVYSEPPAAALAVDGALAGTTPVAVATKPGPHKVQLALAGYAAAERQVSLVPDHALEVNVALEKGAAGLAGAEKPAPVALATPAIPETKPEARPESKAEPKPETAKRAEPEPTPSRPRLWTWVAAGAAGAALAGGVLVGLAAQSNANKLHADQYNGGQVNQQLYNSAKSQALAANVLYGVAAVSAAGSVALFFIEGHY